LVEWVPSTAEPSGPEALAKCDEERGTGGAGRREPVFQQNLHVLDGGDQPILNLHPPEASPAGAFESVMIGRVRKADLRQMLSSAPIASGGGAVRLLTGTVQQGLLFVSVDRASIYGCAGALGA
jgi:hypothetical protein